MRGASEGMYYGKRFGNSAVPLPFGQNQSGQIQKSTGVNKFKILLVDFSAHVVGNWPLLETLRTTK